MDDCHTEIDQFMVNLNNEYEYKPADYQEALEYRLSKSVKDFNAKKYTLSTSVHQFRKYGPGIYLYFMFLKYLMVIFAICSVISLPSLFSNHTGNGIEIFGRSNFNTRLMRYSLANQHYYQWSQITKSDYKQTNMLINKRIIVCSDLIISTVFLFFILFWRAQSLRLVNQSISETALPSYYTIFLPRLPDNYSQQKMRKHFQKFGRISQISSIKNLSAIHKSITQFCVIIDNLKIHRKLLELKHQNSHIKYNNLYNKLIQKYLQLKDEYKNIEKNQNVSAFISFDSIKTRNYVIDLYEYQVSKQDLLYEDQQIVIQKCNIQPTNIVWENLHLDWVTHLKKSILQFFILTIVLFIGFLALFLIQINSNNNFQIDYRAEYTFAEVIQLQQQKVTDTFCYNLSYHSFKEQYYPVCKQSLSRYANQLIITMAYSCVIVFINFLLNLIIKCLGDFRKYSTNTAKNRFLISNMFIFFFINTAILTLILQIEVGDYSIHRVASSIFQFNNMSLGLYSQFTRKWYINVGSQILMNYIVSLMLCPLLPFFLEKMWRKLRQFQAYRKKIQKEMNQAIVDPQFDFNGYYAQILNIIFFCFLYSSCMPILYIFGCISIGIIYLSNKYIFINYSRQPSIFDHSLNSFIISLLPYSLLIHQIMSIFFYNVEEIFPDKNTAGDDWIQEMLRKCHEGICFICFGCVILVYLVFQHKIDRLFERYFNQKTVEKQLFEHEKSFNQLYFNKKFIYSYKIEDNPKYQNILYTLMVLDTLEKNRKQQISRIKSQQHISHPEPADYKSCKLFQEQVLSDIQTQRTLQQHSKKQQKN